MASIRCQTSGTGEAMDPFSQIDDVTGLSNRLEGLVREMSLKTKPTLQHVYALLAFADKSGVREKFDARFGPGSAEAIISKAAQSDAVASLKQAVEVLSKHLSEMPAISGRLEVLSKNLSEMPDVFGRLGAISDAIQAVREPDLSPLLLRLDEVVQAVRESAAKTEAEPADETTGSQAIDRLTAAVEELLRMQKAKRTVLRDINDNVVGLQIDA